MSYTSMFFTNTHKVRYKYTDTRYTIHKYASFHKVRYKHTIHKYTNTHKVRFSSGGRRSATSSCCQLVDLVLKEVLKDCWKLGNEILRTSKEIRFGTHVLDVDFSLPLVLFWDLVNINGHFDRNHDHSRELAHLHHHCLTNWLYAFVETRC